MKGNNQLELNEATMVIAVQYWLDSQFREGLSPKVVAVTMGKNSYSTMFQVEVADRDGSN